MIRLTWRHVWLLVLAALGLWADLRLFLFYASAVILGEFERLFALVHQTSIDQDAKLAALCFNAQISVDDIRNAGVGIAELRAGWGRLKP